MARVKQTQPRTPSPSSSSSGRTPSPPPTMLKRVPIPTHKILANDKGKAAAIDQGKSKKRKEPPTENLMADAMKEVTQKKKKTVSSPPPKKAPSSKDKAAEFVIPPDFLKRKIHEARTLDFSYFDSDGFTFQYHLRFHGLENFLSSSLDTYPKLITMLKRVPIPTHKILANDKGKAAAIDQGKSKKRKEPPTENLMADAMKEVTQKKKKTVSSPPPKKAPSSKDKAAEFVIPPDFLKRKIHEARTLDFSYFDSDGFTFQYHLRFHGLENFLSSSLDTYPKLIRAFYSTFKLTDNGFKAEVKGKRISLSFEDFSNLSGLPFHGKSIDGSSEAEAANEGCEASFDRHTAVKDLMVEGFVETISLPIGQMKVHHRMLMYTLTRMLVPRSGNHAVVQKLDILLLWGLSKELKMSWTWIVLEHMMEASQSKLVLPYPQLITKILKHFKVSLVDEESSKTILVFGESIVNQMQLKRVNGIWIRPLPNAKPVQPPTQQAAEPVAAPPEFIAKLLEFMEAQATHNAKMQESNGRCLEDTPGISKLSCSEC
uniref:Uncharacterized protein LOC105852719 n=1 Tax=Cicer arietinum TaxID=3827 RepID=A0A1S3EFZ4_CICAR|nr:uncharacterized protein LOC105852719 [Cicer arietinum]